MTVSQPNQRRCGNTHRRLRLELCWAGLSLAVLPPGNGTTPTPKPSDVHEPCAESLAAAMDKLSRDPTLVHELSKQARKWAESRSWEALKPVYRDVIERAAGMV